MPASFPDCIVVGAGVIGLTTAHALLKRRLSVAIIDAAYQGMASAASGGILSPIPPWLQPDPVTVLAARSQRIYPDMLRLWRSPLHPLDAPRCGMLCLDGDALPAARAWCRRRGCALRELDSPALNVVAPALDTGYGFHLPHIRRVNPEHLLAALRRWLLDHQARFIEPRIVARINSRSGRVTGVRLDDGTTITAGCVAVCSGAWTEALVPGARIRPIRGQIIELAAEPDLLRPIVLSGDHYLVPRASKRILVGSTLEDVGFDSATTASAARQLLDFARRLVPRLAGRTPINHYAGLRPGALDIPLVGAAGHPTGLFINGGHYRSGITLAPASAELLAQLIAGDAPDIDPRPYSPERRIAQKNGT